MRDENGDARRLIHIPIVHCRSDMGSLGQHFPAVAGYPRVADEFWQQVEAAVKSLELDWPRVKIYQDGLPTIARGGIDRIVASVNSPNYALLRWMIDRGAVAMGTESNRLINEEYAMLRAIIDARDETAKKRAAESYARRASSLLAERDAYIARRIAGTLKAKETGVLFVGLAHQVATMLLPDIEVILLFPDLLSASHHNSA